MDSHVKKFLMYISVALAAIWSFRVTLDLLQSVVQLVLIALLLYILCLYLGGRAITWGELQRAIKDGLGCAVDFFNYIRNFFAE
ncbi:Hypothetical predicted protein [Cloeon dipterum]|uniref:Uncharacterized protein n=1 Tax=Cloeon dipterum TaxID=197152 RepID=A0A8S1CBN6_9INSE|nr:Hypothetical predicted protein [Cloeon dipterum]